jgi:hypothetical protein
MLQASGKVGQTFIRYIVSNESTSMPDNLIPFSAQSLPPNGSDYFYFAATLPGDNVWVDGPNPASTSGWLIAFLFRFTYDSETELRYISMPAVPQTLTKDP